MCASDMYICGEHTVVYNTFNWKRCARFCVKGICRLSHGASYRRHTWTRNFASDCVYIQKGRGVMKCCVRFSVFGLRCKCARCFLLWWWGSRARKGDREMCVCAHRRRTIGRARYSELSCWASFSLKYALYLYARLDRYCARTRNVRGSWGSSVQVLCVGASCAYIGNVDCMVMMMMIMIAQWSIKRLCAASKCWRCGGREQRMTWHHSNIIAIYNIGRIIYIKPLPEQTHGYIDGKNTIIAWPSSWTIERAVFVCVVRGH